MIPRIQQLFFSDKIQDPRDLAKTAWTRSRIYWILRQNASPRSVKIPDPRSCGSWIPDIPWILAHVWNEVWTESVPLLLNRMCPLGQVTHEVLSRVPNLSAHGPVVPEKRERLIRVGWKCCGWSRNILPVRYHIPKWSSICQLSRYGFIVQ